MPVLVLGGGFCGAMTAAHLAARGIACTVIEPGELGRGLAFVDGAPHLVLNTPARLMSALPDDPDHFTRTTGVAPDAFAARAAYGAYVGGIVAGHEIRHVRARAVELAPGFAVRCDDGSEHRGSAVVLALGYAPPRVPPHVDETCVSDPYALAVAPDAPVLVLGTGLTALDAIVGLRAGGHRARIVAVSRRGLLPAAYAPIAAPVTVPDELIARPSLAALIAWWRDAGGDAAARAQGLRVASPAIWRNLGDADRGAFLRHLHARLDVVRHRAPPQVRAVVDRGLAEGWLEVVAGRLVAADRGACTIATRDGELRVDAAAIANCTGPERDLRRDARPFVRALVDGGWVAPDPLGLGGEACVPGVFVVGPWRVAACWESTAVPELRVHAVEVAAAAAAYAMPTR